MKAHRYSKRAPRALWWMRMSKSWSTKRIKEEYRKELIAQAGTAVGATQDYGPSSEPTTLDVTAAHEDQMLWREDVEHCPVKLLRFCPPSAENVSTNAIDNLMYDGKLFLDFRGNPVRDFPSLPLVISCMVEGWRVEAWTRSDKRISMTDIIARIPVESVVDTAGYRTAVPICNVGTLRERAKKFRHSAGLISWGSQGSDPTIEKFMDDLRSPAQKENNQTIGRNLTDHEAASLALLTLGMRPDRARVGQDWKATQGYLDRAQKKSDLTSDFDCRVEHPETVEEIQDIQNAL